MSISLFPKTSKIVLFQNFQVFTRCRFQNVPIRVPFSKSTVFKICRQKISRFCVNRRPIRRIFHRFQNVPASCERSLSVSSIILPYCTSNYSYPYRMSKEKYSDLSILLCVKSTYHDISRRQIFATGSRKSSVLYALTLRFLYLSYHQQR